MLSRLQSSLLCSGVDEDRSAKSEKGKAVAWQVGPGAKGLREDDWVVPLKSHLGTWQTLAVVKASELLVIPKDCMPLEYAALLQQLCLAYRLLEDFGKLKVRCCLHGIRESSCGMNSVGGCMAQNILLI